MNIVFDIDGTLIQSYKMDYDCYNNAVEKVLKINLDTDFSDYQHITDAGILDEILKRNAIGKSSEIIANVKNQFLINIEKAIVKNQVVEVKGALNFIEYLKTRSDTNIAIATGGWYESALMKLKSAGFDVNDIPIATSNDHFDRTNIMTLANKYISKGKPVPYTYFGDAEWDKKACNILQINFILVGNSTNHQQRIDDYSSIDTVMEIIKKAF